MMQNCEPIFKKLIHLYKYTPLLFISILFGCASSAEETNTKHQQYIDEFHLVLVKFSQKLPYDKTTSLEASATTGIIEVEYWIDRLKSLDDLNAHTVRKVHDVQNIMTLIKPHISLVLDNRTILNDADKAHEIIVSYFPPLLKTSEEAVDILEKTGASERQLYLANHLTVYIQQMQDNLKHITSGDEDYAAADRLGRDTGLIVLILEGLLKGSDSLKVGKVYDSEAVQKFRQMAVLLSTVSGDIAWVLETAPALFKLQRATNQVIVLNNQLTLKAAEFD